MHHIYGVPQLHHDQINIIAKHLHEIKQNIHTQRYENDNDKPVPTLYKWTRKKLKETKEWAEWNAAEFTKLNQYES